MLGIAVREMERAEVLPALDRGERPHAVLDANLAEDTFLEVMRRGVPVVAVMLDHWYSSVRHVPTAAHEAACGRLGIPFHKPLLVDACFRPRSGPPGPEDRLYVFTVAPEQVPCYLAKEGVRHAEALPFGVDAGVFRPREVPALAPLGFAGTPLVDNPIDGVRLLREGLDRTGTEEARRVRGILDEVVRRQMRDPFRWRVPELIVEVERGKGADFISGGGLTPEKETWAVLIGVHLAAVQRVTVARALRDLGMAVWGPPEWGLVDGVDYRGEAAWPDGLARVLPGIAVHVNVSKPMFPTGLAPRVLEVLSSGGFLLSNRLPGIEAFFEDGRDLVFYDGLTDMREKAAHYLAHPEERRAIAGRGLRKVQAFHGWAHRAGRIAGVLEADGVLPL